MSDTDHYYGRKLVMVRAYARLVAVALLALAVAGYSGLLDTDPIDNFYHAALGIMFPGLYT